MGGGPENCLYKAVQPRIAGLEKDDPDWTEVQRLKCSSDSGSEAEPIRRLALDTGPYRQNIWRQQT